MKKKLIIGIIVGMTLLLPGCMNRKTKNNDNGLVYTKEENGKEDAINTLQVGSKFKITGTMEKLKGAVVEILGEAYWPDALLSAEEMAERTGISEYMYENFMAEYQHTEAGIDMMIIVEAKEEEVKTVERYLNDYREVLLKIYEQQPQNYAKVFASRIETIENYVCYVQLGADISELQPKGEEEMVAYCQQENERALDVIEKRILSKEFLQ